MNRYDELEEYIKEYCNQRKDKKGNRLINYTDSLLVPLLKKVLETLIQQICKQKTEGQNKIKYLIFQRLLSSGYTGSYELSVGMSNAKLYLDEQIVYEYWKPDYIYEDIDS